MTNLILTIFYSVADSKPWSLSVTFGTIFMALTPFLSKIAPLLLAISPVLTTIGVIVGIAASIALLRYHISMRKKVDQEIEINRIKFKLPEE